MKFVLFYHSLVSDWNHGNAHFLRGIATELINRGHRVDIFEPRDSWSRCNLMAEAGAGAICDFYRVYPRLRSHFYDPETLSLDEVTDGADIVLVHEWNRPEVIRSVSEHRKRNGNYKLFYHDTHHRAVSDPDSVCWDALDGFDGVLAFGESLRQQYIQCGWSNRVWTWHEAADTNVFRPLYGEEEQHDLVWIGNWGDEERTGELREYIFDPVRTLGLRSSIYGVRYPEEARAELAEIGIQYGGWLPNFRAPSIFGQHLLTVHVPRRPYREQLPGIPTIRVFEALACGIPLLCAPWDDCEGLFRPGADYLIARNGEAMTRLIRELREDAQLRHEVSSKGLETIHKRHTCAHRVDQLMEIAAQC